jgi:hypothetical protein
LVVSYPAIASRQSAVRIGDVRDVRILSPKYVVFPIDQENGAKTFTSMGMAIEDWDW